MSDTIDAIDREVIDRLENSAQRAHWMASRLIYEAGVLMLQAMQADTPPDDTTDIVFPPWSDLSLDQRISFDMTMRENHVLMNVGTAVSAIVILMG